MGFIVVISIVISIIIVALYVTVKTLSAPKKIGGIPKLLKDGKYLAAQRVAKSIITKDPKNYVAHYYLGKAYLKDNKSELAFMEYKNVNENALFNGEIPEADFRRSMAELYKKFNQKEDAIKEYLLLTKLEPREASHLFNAAQLYEDAGNNKMAIGFYQKTLMLDKKNSQAYTAVGRILFRAKNFKQAKQALETGVKLSPDNFENYFYLGKICKETKDLSSAVKLLEKSERDPVLKAKALVEKGTCLMLANQIDKAEDTFMRVITNSKDPKNNEVLYARYFLASCYEKNRKIEKAIEQWETIFKINNKFRDVATKLGQYKELETNDGIKDYLTSNNNEFVELGKKIIAAGFNLACQKATITPFGCAMLASEDKKDNWMNSKKHIYYVLFYRSTDVIEDTVVRKVSDELKSKGYSRGIIFASSDFSHSSITFAESRPITLVPKDQLEALFKKVGY